MNNKDENYIDESFEKDGIKEYLEIRCNPEDAGKRLDSFVQECIEGATKSYVQKLIEGDSVLVNGKNAKKSGLKLKGSEIINVNIPEDENLEVVPENIPIKIIYEDKDLVIINKDAGMVVHPAYGNQNGTLVNAIMYHIKDLSSINGVIRPGIVHRLDKDTSGIIVIAKNDRSHINLANMFKEKTLEKTYLCICKGNFKDNTGRVENFIGRDPRDRKKMAVVETGGKKAISNYEVLQEVRGFSLVKVRIETGRTHQIRVHMKSLNRPIYGDSVYGSVDGKDYAKRQMLHAYKLKLTHPITGEEMEVLAPMPEDMKEVCRKLGFDLEILKDK